LETALFIIFFISCLLLIVSVLLQPGKTDAGALFTSGVSSAALNPRGTQSVLSKLTIAMAATFMLSALLLSLPAISGDRSVLTTEGAENETPAANSNTNTNTNSNANVESNSAPAEEKKAGDEKKAAESDAKPEAKDAEKASEEKAEDKASDSKKEEKKDDTSEDKK